MKINRAEKVKVGDLQQNSLSNSKASISEKLIDSGSRLYLLAVTSVRSSALYQTVATTLQYRIARR